MNAGPATNPRAVASPVSVCIDPLLFIRDVELASDKRLQLVQHLLGLGAAGRDLEHGAAHGLDSFEIDDLLLELKMPKLDSDVPREDFIIDFLTKEKDAPVGRMISLKAFDDALVDCGHSPLNTGRKEAQSRKKSTLLPFNSKERKRHDKDKE